MSRTIFQKITSSLWVLVSFIPIFNGLGFVYIGNKYANKNWFLEGILYEIPWLLGIMAMPNFALATILITVASLASYVSMIRAIIVDIRLQRELDQANLLEKSFEEKVDDVINSSWILLSFIPFLNGSGLIHKGRNTQKKSLLVEGIIYEIPWILGILAWSIQSVRFLAFELAFVFYFTSIVRSVMVNSGMDTFYETAHVSIGEKARSYVKSKDINKLKIKEKENNYEVNDGVVPAFQFYEKKFKELEEIYPLKEKNTMDLIEKRFAPPQLTYSRFKRVVDNSHETFYSQLNTGYKILELSNEYSTKVEDELKNKLLVLNSLIKGLDKLSEELVLNISQIESESDDELDELFGDFSRATRSVKHY